MKLKKVFIYFFVFYHSIQDFLLALSLSNTQNALRNYKVPKRLVVTLPLFPVALSGASLATALLLRKAFLRNIKNNPLIKKALSAGITGIAAMLATPHLVSLTQKIVILPNLLESLEKFSKDFTIVDEIDKKYIIQNPDDSENIYIRGVFKPGAGTIQSIKDMYSLKKIKRGFSNIMNYLFDRVDIEKDREYLYNDLMNYKQDKIKNKNNSTAKKLYEYSYEKNPVTATEFPWNGKLQKEKRIKEAWRYSKFLEDKIHNTNKKDIKIVGHSYGGVMSIHALYILYKQGKLKDIKKPIYLNTIGSPLSAEEYYVLQEMMEHVPNLYYCGVFLKEDNLPNSDPFNEGLISTEIWLKKLEENINKNVDTEHARVKIFTALELKRQENKEVVKPINHNDVDKISSFLLKTKIFNSDFSIKSNLLFVP